VVLVSVFVLIQSIVGVAPSLVDPPVVEGDVEMTQQYEHPKIDGMY
jgi:hypothetical protein